MPDKPVTPEVQVVLAAVTGAHGVTGEVRLKLFGEGIASLKPHKSFSSGALTLTKLHDDGKGGAIARFAEVADRTAAEALRGTALTKLHDDGKGGAIARFAEVADRTAAEALRGTALTVSRSTLPPLGEGEYYYADLIGLPAVSSEGEALGLCVAVENFGAGEVLEIEKSDGTRFMVPMKVEAVPEWSDLNGLLIDAAWVA